MNEKQVSIKNSKVNANIVIAGLEVDHQAKAKKKLAHLLQTLELYLGKLSHDSTIDICFAVVNTNVYTIGFPIIYNKKQKYYIKITFGNPGDCWSVDSNDLEPRVIKIINQKLQAMHKEI